ncbi:hypothetical protein GYA54_03220 [Candidatus Kuenenbacteria bacterium]|nr:hypothetical protein [Candidatus Kuenenbacteria bacterium]
MLIVKEVRDFTTLGRVDGLLSGAGFAFSSVLDPDTGTDTLSFQGIDQEQKAAFLLIDHDFAVVAA